MTTNVGSFTIGHICSRKDASSEGDNRRRRIAFEEMRSAICTSGQLSISSSNV
jgi:hypothetical protein